MVQNVTFDSCDRSRAGNRFVTRVQTLADKSLIWPGKRASRLFRPRDIGWRGFSHGHRALGEDIHGDDIRWADSRQDHDRKSGLKGLPETRVNQASQDSKTRILGPDTEPVKSVNDRTTSHTVQSHLAQNARRNVIRCVGSSWTFGGRGAPSFRKLGLIGLRRQVSTICQAIASWLYAPYEVVKASLNRRKAVPTQRKV
jgi:hypothetical protein